MTWTIYRIRFADGGVYVGQTRQEPIKRWSAHVGADSRVGRRLRFHLGQPVGEPLMTPRLTESATALVRRCLSGEESSVVFGVVGEAQDQESANIMERRTLAEVPGEWRVNDPLSPESRWRPLSFPWPRPGSWHEGVLAKRARVKCCERCRWTPKNRRRSPKSCPGSVESLSAWPPVALFGERPQRGLFG